MIHVKKERKEENMANEHASGAAAALEDMGKRPQKAKGWSFATKHWNYHMIKQSCTGQGTGHSS